MFEDKRSKSVIAVAHCILNQNAISDGTATHSGTFTEVVELLNYHGIGILQMPCPELHCLGLDRGDIQGSTRPVTEENTRIRKMMNREDALEKMEGLVQLVVYQMEEYLKNGFEFKGIVGMNRSPSCGVESTSEDNLEVAGQGVFIEELQRALLSKGIQTEFAGIKASEPESAKATLRKMIGRN